MPVCTIKLLDEVNCRCENLDPAVRRKCVNALSFMLPYARHLPSVKLGRWDGKKSFFTVGGSTYINLLDKVLPIIEDAGYDIEIEDFRQAFNFDITHIDENVVSHINWPASHSRMANQPIVLEPHQVKIINTFLDNLQCVTKAATGSGKCLTGETVLEIEIDENNIFGKYLLSEINKQQAPEINVTKRKEDKGNNTKF